jgi:hypothetical protein
MWQPSVPHWFFTDLGMSPGMVAAEKRCKDMGIRCEYLTVPRRLGSFLGEDPPHTAGFDLDVPEERCGKCGHTLSMHTSPDSCGMSACPCGEFQQASQS